MLRLLRHLLAIAVLPGTVTILIPLWIRSRYAVTVDSGDTPLQLAAQLLGVLLIAAGLVLFAATLLRFAIDGDGTLAPWDPPRELVVRGPYRFVRNPMISGVILILCGEACVLVSRPHAIWAGVFTLINMIYIPLLEEPLLQRRFGAPYREYRRHVPRFLPRLRPWQGDGTTAAE